MLFIFSDWKFFFSRSKVLGASSHQTHPISSKSFPLGKPPSNTWPEHSGEMLITQGSKCLSHAGTHWGDYSAQDCPDLLSHTQRPASHHGVCFSTRLPKVKTRAANTLLQLEVEMFKEPVCWAGFESRPCFRSDRTHPLQGCAYREAPGGCPPSIF